MQTQKLIDATSMDADITTAKINVRNLSVYSFYSSWTAGSGVSGDLKVQISFDGGGSWIVHDTVAHGGALGADHFTETDFAYTHVRMWWDDGGGSGAVLDTWFVGRPNVG